MIRYLIESQLILLVVLLFYKTVLHTTGAFARNRIFLLCCVPVALILPTIDLPLLPTTSTTLPTLSPEIITASGTITTTGTTTHQLSNLLWGIYLTGVLIIFGGMIYGYTRTLRLRITGKSVSVKGHRTILHEKIESPFSFFGTIYINSLPQQGTSATLEHELAHIRLGHSWDLLLICIVKAILWWSPGIWWWQSLTKELHEFQADKESLKKEHITKEEYIHSILTELTGNYPEFASGFKHSLTKKRLLMMTNNVKKGKSRLFLSIPLLLGIMVVFCLSEKAQASIGEQQQQKKQEQQKAEIDTKEQVTIVKFGENKGKSTIEADTILVDKKTSYIIIRKNGEKRGNGIIITDENGKSIDAKDLPKKLLPVAINGEIVDPNKIDLSGMKMDENNSYSIMILNSEKGEEKYGEKGKAGVIDIKVTKK